MGHLTNLHSDRKMDYTGILLLLAGLSAKLVHSQDGAASERTCYVCSGKFPDRDCELYPQYVTMGPGKKECAQATCSTTVRYKPKKHLVKTEADSMGTVRPLDTADFVVDSIARECNGYESGNGCEMDPQDLTITCQEICKSALCTSGLPSPENYVIKENPTENPIENEGNPTIEEDTKSNNGTDINMEDKEVANMYDDSFENSYSTNDSLVDSMGYDNYPLVDDSKTNLPESNIPVEGKESSYEYQEFSEGNDASNCQAFTSLVLISLVYFW